MRKLHIKIGFIIVILVIGSLLLLLKPELREWVKKRYQQLAGLSIQPPRIEDKIPALPDISMQINRTHEMTIYQGIPLIFSITLANQRAMNSALKNVANENHIKELQAAVSRVEINREKAEKIISSLRQKEEIRVIRLGDEQTGWEQFVRFEIRLPDGKQQPLAWPLKLVAQPKEETVTLDDKNTFQLDYAFEPAGAAQVQKGEYQIVAVLEVPAETKLPSDRWRGRVESEPVKLKINEKPARLSKEEEERFNLDLARYFMTAGDVKNALDHAQKAMTVNPKSIPALIETGDAKEASGDLEGALSAYQKAMQEFYQQYPDSYEAPEYLIYKTTSLMEKLNIIQPKKK